MAFYAFRSAKEHLLILLRNTGFEVPAPSFIPSASSLIPNCPYTVNQCWPQVVAASNA